MGTVTTTETLSTEATPEHHRGCFNAPRASPAVLDSDLPSPPTTIADPKHIRHPRPHTLSAPTTHPVGHDPHTPHPRPPFSVIPGPPQMSFRAKSRNPSRSCTIPTFPNGPPVRHLLPRPGTCYHTRHVPRFPRPTPSGDVGAPLGACLRSPNTLFVPRLPVRNRTSAGLL